MIKLRLSLVLLLFSISLMAQESYSESAADLLLAEYTKLKDDAKNAADYATAAVYKEKVDAINALKAKSVLLKTAVENEDFQLATSLQQQIEHGWAVVQGRAVSPPPAPVAATSTTSSTTKPRGVSAIGRYLNPVAVSPVTTAPKKARVVRPAASTAGGPRISRHDVSTLNISNLQMGESVTLTGQTGTYMQFTSTPLDGMGVIYSDHGPIAGLNVGMGFIDPANAGYDIQYMTLQLGSGYAVNVDAYTAFATIELTALYWSVLDPDFAGQDATSTFAAFPQGAASLRLGFKVRPFFKENSANGIGSRYKSFHAYVDAPFSGGPGMFSLGFTSTLFK